MQFVTFSKEATVRLVKSSGSRDFTFAPGHPYVVSDDMARQFAGTEAGKSVVKASELEPRLVNFHVGSLPGRNHPQHILFYAGSAGYGDQIMAWPVAKHLADLGHNVDILCDPGNEVCWQQFPWVRRIVSLPLEGRHFDLDNGHRGYPGSWMHHAFFERVVNSDAHPGQLHPTDAMMRRMGVSFSPRTAQAFVPLDQKTVAPIFTPEEQEAVKSLQDGRRTAIYQLCASGPSRSFSPDHAAFMLDRLAREFHDLCWFVLTDIFTPQPYMARLREVLRQVPNIEWLQTDAVRTVWALIGRSEVVVTPDSMSMHVAGVLKRPCVAYFGATSPYERTTYYPTVQSMGSGQCILAPCLHTKRGFPTNCPGRDHCQELDSITAEQMTRTVRQVYKT